MQTLRFELISRYTRQFFDYDTGSALIRILYDSGANIPVWCTGEEYLLIAYPDAIKTEYVCHVSGFGRGRDAGSVYIIPRFELRDGACVLSVLNLMIAVVEKQLIGCDFIVSETMMEKTNTFTYRIGQKLLQIDYEKEDGVYYCTPMKMNGELIGVSVWMNQM